MTTDCDLGDTLAYYLLRRAARSERRGVLMRG
jgi:hypothetical protein